MLKSKFGAKVGANCPFKWVIWGEHPWKPHVRCARCCWAIHFSPEVLVKKILWRRSPLLGPIYAILDHFCIGFLFMSDCCIVHTALPSIPEVPRIQDNTARIQFALLPKFGTTLCVNTHSRAFSVSDSWKRSGMKSNPISCNPVLKGACNGQLLYTINPSWTYCLSLLSALYRTNTPFTIQVIPEDPPKYGSTNRSLLRCKTLPAHFSNNMPVNCLQAQ